MKFPRFGADLKTDLIQLFIGTASLQGFLFLLLDDGLSVFESGWQISLVVSLLYCVIPCAMVVVWKLFIRKRGQQFFQNETKEAPLKFWVVLVVLSVLITLGLTVHIIWEFQEDLPEPIERGAIWTTLGASFLVVVAVIYIFIQTLSKQKLSLKDLKENEKIKIEYDRSRRALNLEALVVMMAITFGAFYIFSNTRMDPFGSDSEMECADENGRRSFAIVPDKQDGVAQPFAAEHSSWNAPCKKDPLKTKDLIQGLRSIDRTIKELSAGKNYVKLISVNESKRLGQNENKDIIYVVDSLLSGAHESKEVQLEENIYAAYLSDFGPERSLTASFYKILSKKLHLLEDLNKRRSDYFKDTAYLVISQVNTAAVDSAKKAGYVPMPNFRKSLDTEITELKQYRGIIESDLKFHLQDKVVVIQFDAILVLSVFFLIAMMLWYLFSYSAITMNADTQCKFPKGKPRDGGKDDAEEEKKRKKEKQKEFETAIATETSYLGQAGYFKNMSMYLIILFLPLLKFDAHNMDLLDHPFWNIKWSDVKDGGSADKKDESIEINGPLLTDVDVTVLMDSIRTEMEGGFELDPKKLDSLEKLLKELKENSKVIKDDTKVIRNRVR